MSHWDDPDLKADAEFFKFDNVGDSIAGTITKIGKHKFDDGKVATQIGLTTDAGREWTVTAGQVRLAAALQEHRPEVGDHISMSYTQKEPRPGGKTLKHFDVKVTRTGQPATATATAAPAATPAAAPATPAAADPDAAPTGVDPAVWAQMDQTQRDKLRAALGLA